MNKREHSDEGLGPSQPKRLRTSDTDKASDRLSSIAPDVPFVPPPTATWLSHDDYTIAWICALPLELRASRAMFDDEHLPLPPKPKDINTYALGRIQGHNVVMACLPGEYGMNNAAIVATNLHRSFHKIRATFMVGIGGGAPSEDYDIHLGDIVVGDRVVQYDMGKDVEEGKFQRTGRSMYPPTLLSSVISHLRATHTNGVWSPRVSDLLRTKLSSHARPNKLDQLFQASYPHTSKTPTCDGCDSKRLETRPPRESSDPKIHYGGIASANTVMKNARTRDDIARELSICCFEMEAAGIMDKQCLPIRGICDYSDSHKNKAWQDYAAATAAAYARGLLEVLQPEIAQPTPASIEAQLRRSERREQLLSSIHFDKLSDRYHDVKEAHSETCGWFLTHPKYQSWLDPEKRQQTRSFLWVEGKAGAGKSTIMKFACSDIKQNQLGAVVAPFFFNARGGLLEQSVVGMYRSLLWRLLHALPDLQVVLDNPFDISPGQKVCPSIRVLQKLFRNAVMGLGQRALVCFVDALDESDEGDVEAMVEFFDELSENTTKQGIQFLVCFSSRPYPRIAVPPEVRIVLGDEAGHKGDLAYFVAKRLKVANSWVLQDRILEKADGVFMWVVLVVGILNRESNNGALALQKKLGEIPPRLSDLFKNILLRDQHNVDRLLLSVLWVLCANRPLSPIEFRHAVWVGELSQGEVDTVLKDNSLETAINLVTSSSKGLAEVTASEWPRVQFIHESVRDFLVKENGLREIWPNLRTDWEACAHEKLKNCCDTYLSLEGVQSMLKVFEKKPKWEQSVVAAKRYPFLRYACQNILRHADSAAIAIPQHDFIDAFITPAGIRALNHVGTEDQLYSSDAPSLYILADQGLATLVRMQVRRTPATYTTEKYQHPFFAALAGYHYPSVAALLGLPSIICDGVDITVGLGQWDDDYGLPRFSGRTPLTWASQEGKLNLMKAVIQRGANVNEAGPCRTTGLELALRNNHPDAAWLLIDNGATFFASRWVQSWMIPTFFSKIDRVARAQFLLDKEAISLGQWEGATVLINAIDSGSDVAARLVIQQGADINATAFGGRTAFMSALRERHQAIAQLLIDKGVDVPVYGQFEGKTALMHALRAGFDDVARQLIIKGASVDANDNLGRSVLNYAVETGSVTVIRHLIIKGAPVNAEDNVGRTALIHASMAGHETIVRLLINNGVHVNHLDKDGKTALIHASATGNEAVARLLIDNGAYVNHSDKARETALIHASATGNEAVARLLIDNGAHVNHLDKDGKTALMHATKNSNEAIGQLLIDNSADVHLCEPMQQTTALHMASAAGRGPLVRLLIEKGGANVHASSSGGKTALMEAASYGSQATARILIEEGGADVNARDKNQSTALLWATWSGSESVVQLLIEKGADIEARDESQWTALMWAATPAGFMGNTFVTRCLIEGGVQVEARDNFGLTALMRASAAGDSDIVSILLNEGRADFNTRDSRGWTALMMAANAGKGSVVELLLAKKADALVQIRSGWTALSLAKSGGHSRVARLLELQGER